MERKEQVKSKEWVERIELVKRMEWVENKKGLNKRIFYLYKINILLNSHIFNKYEIHCCYVGTYYIT